MTERRRLTDAEITDHLVKVPGWEVQHGQLRREFQFDNFVQAWSFMTAVALLAERRDHHPDWSNVYNRVVINLSTHDVGGISQWDFELAAAINTVLP